MQRTKSNLTSIPTLSTIYLRPMHNEAMKGYVYSQYYKKAFQFQNECEMLNGMDDLFNSIVFPQALFESRSFINKKSKQMIKKVDAIMDERIEDLLQNDKTTFIVNVQYRQNASWQGTITWVEQNHTQHFRSALEMPKLMEQANNQGATEIVDWADNL
jgi:hypothetical protein